MQIGSPEWSQLIIDGARAFDLDLDSRHTDQFAAHALELLHWNRTINLTTVIDPRQIALKHLVDSLAPAELISPGATLLDIGSGGGFPGLALKVAVPSLAVTLVDASRKKVSFLKHVIRSLGLEGVEALCIRAEDLAAGPTSRGCFDLIISRALANLKSYFYQARPLLAVTGTIIALKGRVDRAEVEALESCIRQASTQSTGQQRSFSLAVETYTLPFSRSHRSIFTIRPIEG